VEKFFTIKKDSEFYNTYFQYLGDLKINREVFDRFCKEIDIESGSYLPSKDWLIIVPSEKDKDKFVNQFTQEYFDGGGRQFKKRSVIGQEWTRAMRDVKAARRPGYFRWVDLVGRYTERIFHIGEIIYGSLNAECTFHLHDCMEEIKASEFYRIIEEYNESIKSKKAEG
jgi:hypothetical protein